MEDGMHSQRVYSILQTSDGAIWWGTKNGVERYNGVTIRHYQLGEQDKYSNDAGRIIKLLVDEERDSSKSLYAYDDKGFIFVYDAATDRFKLKVNIREMVGGEIRLNDICPTEQGLWTATNQGIYILDGRTAKAVTKDVYANCIVRTEKNLIFCTFASPHSR
jgi:ligand-binding sensor domain-containing protein